MTDSREIEIAIALLIMYLVVAIVVAMVLLKPSRPVAMIIGAALIWPALGLRSFMRGIIAAWKEMS